MLWCMSSKLLLKSARIMLIRPSVFCWRHYSMAELKSSSGSMAEKRSWVKDNVPEANVIHADQMLLKKVSDVIIDQSWSLEWVPKGR